MHDRLGAHHTIDDATLDSIIDEHERVTLPRLQRLWAYYRNAPEPVGSLGSAPQSATRRRYQQEQGLPARLTGRTGDPTLDDRLGPRREVVIENDIAWRVQAMIDFMFAKPVRVLSESPDKAKREQIERIMAEVWHASGGVSLMQDIALVGHVYGHVDLLLRLDEPALLAAGDDPSKIARAVRIELVQPSRGIPVVDEHDYRKLKAYILTLPRKEMGQKPAGALRRVLGLGGQGSGRERSIEILVPGVRTLRIGEAPARAERSALLPAELPVVHIQNIQQPFRYEGVSEVEPLIPLQDELNTRLSDRASRVTMQSFKMYIARGIEGFEKIPVGPGQVWATDNPEASVEAFGGDASSPSEEKHIEEIREALDKQSGVPPIAAGVVRAKIGNLSSANALRITLMGVLSKTARKRVTYGDGITRLGELLLKALDRAGTLRTEPADRRLSLLWPDPLPADPREQAAAAVARRDLGVPEDRVLAELGYPRPDRD
ncbi:MAG: phage portal protein [Phycisphaerales bacterium]|nr:phage portal protein [Phycisphaerales bacterium]